MIPMWMSELSERSGVAVPTIKFYLREGLLPPGEATGATRARYGEEHVRRLRLIRALVHIAGMSLERVRQVLAAMDEEPTLDAAIGMAHTELSPEPASPPSEVSRTRVARLVTGARWRVDPDGRHGEALASALDAMDAAGQPISDKTLATYVDATAAIAKADLDSMGDRTRDGAAAFAVIGTLLTEPVMVALRRMAQENLARRRLS
ncbi:MerR family transcriptional regulator [Nocardioides speluncae]|uniref:MerR family transcriptional regulator n=1 Tax=Nocardioides speluncae TaxID=2670337 RepID=UPI000D68B0EC|nr:MerR family transcriptional regulator [Nocardioides speluncae]